MLKVGRHRATGRTWRAVVVSRARGSGRRTPNGIDRRRRSFHRRSRLHRRTAAYRTARNGFARREVESAVLAYREAGSFIVRRLSMSGRHHDGYELAAQWRERSEQYDVLARLWQCGWARYTGCGPGRTSGALKLLTQGPTRSGTRPPLRTRSEGRECRHHEHRERLRRRRRDEGHSSSRAGRGPHRSRA